MQSQMPEKTEGKLYNKLAVITASTSGIGLAIARRFVDEGAYVIISSRYQSHVDKALKEFENNHKVQGITCDVGNFEDRTNLINYAIQCFNGKQKIDIIVSNAATSPYVGSSCTIPLDAYDHLFDINVKASFYLVCQAVNHIQDGGNILFVSSVAAYEPSTPIGVYGITKTALIGVTKAFAQELAWRKIRVNCIAPGIVKTRFSAVLWDTPDSMEFSASRALLKRVGDCDEIAGPACFLCSEDASFITGETLLVSGGGHSRL